MNTIPVQRVMAPCRADGVARALEAAYRPVRDLPADLAALLDRLDSITSFPR